MKKMVLIAIVAVLALTTVGFGFAKWTASVNGNIQVQTGNLAIGIKDLGTNDDGVAQKGLLINDDVAVNPLFASFQGQLGADPNYGKGLNDENKNVASLTSYNNQCEPLANYPGYYSKITEVLLNGYPWYSPSTEIQVTNLGSIPVKLNNIQINWLKGTDSNTGRILSDLSPWMDLTYKITVPSTSPFSDASTTKSGTGLDAFEAAINGLQLHAGDAATVDLTFGLRETDSVTGAYTTPESGNLLPMNAEGIVSFSVDGTQWNEVK